MNGIDRVIRVLTAPGVWIRSFWVHLLCRIWAVPVTETRLFQNKATFGHLQHMALPTVGAAFAIGFVPVLLNRLLALLLFLSSLLGLFLFRMTGWVALSANTLAFWFAFSLYVNTYPPAEHARRMQTMLRGQGTRAQKILLAPGTFCCAVGSFLARRGVTFLLACAGLAALVLWQGALFAAIARWLPNLEG